jgi:hypothetical protein
MDQHILALAERADKLPQPDADLVRELAARIEAGNVTRLSDDHVAKIQRLHAEEFKA